MIYKVRPSACDMIGYPIFYYATYGCNLFCRDLWIFADYFLRIVSVVTAEVSVVSLMFFSCLKQVYESAMRLQDEHRGLKSLYPSKFDITDIVSTEIHCFSSKFDGLLQKIPIATICFNHLFPFHSLKQISQ